MAIGKSPRMDRRSSTSYCSTMTLVVFVALCLVGVWMMTSSTIVPEEMPSPGTKTETKQQVSENDSRPFGDSSEVATEDRKQEGTDDSEISSRDDSDSQPSEGQKLAEKTSESLDDKTEGKNPVKDNETEDSLKGNTEDKEKTNELDSTSEQSSKETANREQEQQEDGKKSEQEENPDGNTVQNEKDQGQIEQKVEENQDKGEQKSDEIKTGNQAKDEVFPDGAQSELLNETNTQNGAWSTQAAESKNEKEVQQASLSKDQIVEYNWKLCNVAAGTDFIPCLDNVEAIKKLSSTKHYEHRERHCPDNSPTCLVSLPDGYQQPIKWPKSRDQIWYHNVPHTKLAQVKGHQNWVKVSGEYLTFPGGGTQFKNGALHYIDKIQEALPDIAWGKRSRVVLDVGCGVASFGGFLFDRDVLTMSFAPKDEHEAQVQFALERGIPGISAVMGTKRLPFPSGVYDIVHCARCRVPWHIEGGKLLLELNRMLRPGGYFVWSATPVYRNITEDVQIWKEMSALTKSMCWKMVKKTEDSLNQVGLAIYRKPTDNECYEQRTKNNPPLCQESDDPNAAWNVPLQACMHRVPVDPAVRGSHWPEQWPERTEKVPYWLSSSQKGVYGKAAPEDFKADYEHWKRVVSKSYLKGMGIDWSTVRNVMDMGSIYGG